WNDGFNMVGSDRDADEFEFSNHFYERGAELEKTTVQWFGDWTDTFSTELRVGFATLDNRQISRGQGFAEMQIETYFDGDNDGDLDRALVYLGGDDSRQSNDLEYDTFNFKFGANWAVGDHLISAGLEQEAFDIFNVFVQHSIGEIRFDEENTDLLGNTVGCSSGGNPDGCIDQFEAFSPDDIYYGNAPSLDPSDAAGIFEYAVNSLYVQDEFTLADGDVTVVAGLRYDWYSSSDLPRENSNFIARTGFTNAQNFDGESLLQPRLGVSWEVNEDLTLRGGIGLYSGGNPNVWLSNAYSNDGFTAVQVREFNGGVSDLNIDPTRSLQTIPLGVDGNGRPGYDAPQSMIQAVSSGSANSSVVAVDPGFKIPSAWKYSLGASWVFGDGYLLNADMIFSQADESAVYRDDTLVQISTAPDGRPIYAPVDKSILPPDCATDPIGTGIAVMDLDECDRSFTNDFILDNVIGDDAEQFAISASLQKDHDFGLSWMLGYAYVESDEVSPMTSSVAFSNWILVATADSNNPGLARSNYEIPHRFVLRLDYEREFFGDLTTRFSLFGQANQGRPYSATFSEQEMFICGDNFSKSGGDCLDDDRSLLYMPDGPSDPNVIFAPGFDQDEFFAWAAANDLTKYGGGIVPRNAIEGSWWNKFDLRISQDLPGFSPDHRAQIWFNIENLANLLNDDWGVLYERSFPRTAAVVEASLPDFVLDGTSDNDFSDAQYTFESFTSQGESRVAKVSVWRIRFGFNYRF
ncbi:MAG: TonB-dependent receptor, partial [Gammaproteobacteria bacterium]|nr:TonB-dependent receptor [Gammaproteobacteria bacterium]